jgi:hypothetical protein
MKNRVFRLFYTLGAFFVIFVSFPQETLSAGKMDGIWAGKLDCFLIEPSGNKWTERALEGSSIYFTIQFEIINNRILNNHGFPGSKTKSFAISLDVKNSSFIVKTIDPKMGKLQLVGKFLNVDGDRFFKVTGDAEDDRECESYFNKR